MLCFKKSDYPTIILAKMIFPVKIQSRLLKKPPERLIDVRNITAQFEWSENHATFYKAFSTVQLRCGKFRSHSKKRLETRFPTVSY